MSAGNSPAAPGLSPIPSLTRFLLAGLAALLSYSALFSLGQDRSRLLMYPVDRAYADLAAARSWVETGALGAGGEKLPAQADSLWQFLLSLAYRAGVQLLAAPLLVSLIFSIAGLWALLAWARAISPRPTYLWWVTAAWVLTAPLLVDAFSGQSLVLGGALAMLAFVSHQNGLQSGRTPLPLAAAALVGLALLVRVEFAALWALFGLHALLLAGLRRIETGIPTLLVRWLNGFLLGGIFLSPLIGWNLDAVSVPWPAAPGAALAINLFGAESVSTGASASAGFAAAWQAIAQGPIMGNGLIRLFMLAGAICLVLDVVRGRAGIATTTLLVGLLMPFVFAFLHPFLGAEALPHLQRALLPAWLLLAGYAVVSGADGLNKLTERANLQFPRTYTYAAAALLIGAMPVLAGLRDQVTAQRKQRAAQRAAHEARAEVAMRLGSAADFQGGVLSDQPGWLLFQRYPVVLDLGGRLHPVVMNWVDRGNLRDEAGFQAYLAGREIRTAVFWQPAPPALSRFFSCPPAPETGPVICAINPRAGP